MKYSVDCNPRLARVGKGPSLQSQAWLVNTQASVLAALDCQCWAAFDIAACLDLALLLCVLQSGAQSP